MNDKDTLKVLSDGEKLSSMVKGDGWAIARKRLIEKIMELTDILSVSEKDPNKLMMEIGARQLASQQLLEWLRDIEGDAKRNETNQEMFRKYKEETFITIIE